MKRLLSYGYKIEKELIIKDCIFLREKIQIYETNKNKYVLAFTKEILNLWNIHFGISQDIFIKKRLSRNDLWIFITKEHYLLSSLSEGPFPVQECEVKNFAASYKIFTKKHPDKSMKDAIFIEEFGLILPIDNEIDLNKNNLFVFGEYLTKGVHISPKDFLRFSELVGWIERIDLYGCLALAGIKLNEKDDEFEVKNTRTSKLPVEDLESLEEDLKSSDEFLEFFNEDSELSDEDSELSDEDSELSAKDLELPKEDFELPGRPELQKFFNEEILHIIKNENKYLKRGITFPGATILYGPPGTGKTYAIEKLAKYLGWNTIYINSNNIASSLIHDTSKKISNLFNKAMSNAPSIIIIDEMERYLSKRKESSQEHYLEEMAEFLTLIPKAIKKKVLIFGLTNRYEDLDPAIVRKGRFDHHIEVLPANSDEIYLLLENKFKELPIHKEVKTNKIANKLAYHPLSDVTFLLREAIKISIREDKEEIDSECFEKAFLKMEPTSDDNSNRRIGFLEAYKRAEISR